MLEKERFICKKSYLFWLSILAVTILTFYKISSVLLPFYIAIFVTVLFSGIISECEKKFHIPRAISSMIITLLFCAFVMSCIYALFNVGTKATGSVVKINSDKDIVGNISILIGNLLQKFEIENTFNLLANQFSDLVADNISFIISNLVGYSTNIIGTIFLCILSPIVMFMMLKDSPLIKKKIYLLCPKNIKNDFIQLTEEVHESVFKYIEGQTVVAIVLSMCYSLLLFSIGLKHFVLLGILIGFSSFIPYIGFYFSTTVVLFSVYNQFHDLKRMLVTLLFLLIMQVIDCSFITPKIVGKKLGVHPLFVIFGVLVSVPLFGFIGVILALPIVGIVGVVFKFLVKKYKNSDYYNNKL